MKISLQNVFNNAYRGFVHEKGSPSFDPERGICAYRGANGTKCIIGFSIPDEDYDPRIEGIGILTLQVPPSETCLDEDYLFAWNLFHNLFEMDTETVTALGKLQSIHDLNANKGEWDYGFSIKTRLESFAIQHNLTIPEEPCHAA